MGDLGELHFSTDTKHNEKSEMLPTCDKNQVTAVDVYDNLDLWTTSFAPILRPIAIRADTILACGTLKEANGEDKSKEEEVAKSFRVMGQVRNFSPSVRNGHTDAFQIDEEDLENYF